MSRVRPCDNLLDPLQYCSLTDPILVRAKDAPDSLAIIFMNNDGSEDQISAARLHAESVKFATCLRDKNVKPNDVVIVAVHHSPALIYSFWGCLYLGAVPSIFPYLVPRPSADTFKRQIEPIVAQSRAKAVITDPEYEHGLREALKGKDCTIVNSSTLLSGKDAATTSFSLQNTAGKEIAYLQFTSGTTGLQKGVLLSHTAILHFVEAFARALDIRNDDAVINWMPLFHDGGLFGGMIMPLVMGIPTLLMSPFKWIRSPKTFFWAIHQHRGTLCWMPNSAFHHAVRFTRERDLSGLDLSSLRMLISAAEPVYYESQQIFLEHFARYGFKETALGVGYGLAENTLAVTITKPGERAHVEWIDKRELQENHRAAIAPPKTNGAMSVVSCGSPLPGTNLKILDERGKALPERKAGEISIRGASLFSGYYDPENNPPLTPENHWFRTGDMGYMSNGELYVCGRKKDMIIVAGRNVYPEDIEYLAGTVAGVCSDRTVAFGLSDEGLGSERIVLVCDVERSVHDSQKAGIERQIRRLVFQELDLTLSEVLLTKKGWVVKTANGKISRMANRNKYEAGFF